MAQQQKPPFAVPCSQCRFWNREYEEALQGARLLAAGDMSPGDGSQAKLSVESEYWDRESSLTGGGSTSAALYTQHDFSCIQAEAGTPDPAEHP